MKIFPGQSTVRSELRNPRLWEIISGIGVAAGILMIVQPFFKVAYGYGFIVLLIMTGIYIIVSHFPNRSNEHG